MQIWQRYCTSQLMNVLYGIVLLLPGCASIIVAGVFFKSEPSGAKLMVYAVRKGKGIINAMTPHTATLERGAGYFKPAEYRVVVDKEGYEKQEVTIRSTVNGWYIGGNLLFGGPIGWLIVDPLTGAMYNLPKDVSVELSERKALEQLEGGQGLVLLLKERETLPEEVKRQMTLVGRLSIPEGNKN